MKTSSGLNSSQLKLIACLAMLLDHLGCLIFPASLGLRAVGRLAFPIFAFMVANGYRHTGDKWRYFLRLAAFALFFQPIFSYCMGGGHLNIFSTLGLGLLLIILWEEGKDRGAHWLSLVSAIAIPALGEWLHCEYGAYGLLLIFCSHLFFDHQAQLSLAWAMINLIYVCTGGSLLQPLSLAALPLLFLYNHQPGKMNRWFFYAFYCLHIPALYWISTLL